MIIWLNKFFKIFLLFKMPDTAELQQKITELELEISTIKREIPNLKLTINQLNKDFTMIFNLLKKK